MEQKALIFLFHWISEVGVKTETKKEYLQRYHLFSKANQGIKSYIYEAIYILPGLNTAPISMQYTHAHTHAYRCTYAHIHMHTFTRMHTHASTVTHTFICTHIHVHSCIHSNSYVLICIHMHTYIHTYLHTGTHTSTCISQ